MKTLIAVIAVSVFSNCFGQGSSDEIAVKECLINYLDGRTYGDSARLTSAFHPSATMKYIDFKTGEFKDTPITEYLKASVGKKMDRKTRIVSFDIFETSAQAKLEMDFGDFIVCDYLNLLKINGEWKIVSKVFSRKNKK